MKKKILMGVMMAMVAMSVTACGDAKTDSAVTAEANTEAQPQEGDKGLKEMFEKDDSNGKTKEEETETETETEPEKTDQKQEDKKQTNDKSEVSDDWEDMQFIMNKEFYALPMPFSVLEDEGWEINTDVYDEGEDVEPGETKVVCIYNDDYDEDMSTFVNVTNYGKSTKSLSDCVISSFSMDIVFGETLLKDIPKIAIAQGITWGSTADEVVEAFGKPNNTYESEVFEYTTYYYEADDCNLELDVYDDFGVADIEIRTRKEKASTSSGHSSSSTSSNAKKKDADISDDWKDMEFILDGEKYSLEDAPYETLQESGWDFDLADYGHEDGYVLNPNDQISSTVCLENSDYDEDVDVTVGFINRTKKIKDIKECSIWSFSCCVEYGGDLLENVPEMTIAQGITWGSTADEVLDAFGEADDEYRSDDLGYTKYTYEDDYDKYLEIYVYDDYGVTEIQMRLYE